MELEILRPSSISSIHVYCCKPCHSSCQRWSSRGSVVRALEHCFTRFFRWFLPIELLHRQFPLVKDADVVTDSEEEELDNEMDDQVGFYPLPLTKYLLINSVLQVKRRSAAPSPDSDSSIASKGFRSGPPINSVLRFAAPAPESPEGYRSRLPQVLSGFPISPSSFLKSK